jgi:spore maturation protein SpmB
MSVAAQPKKNVIEVFMAGAKDGYTMGVNLIAPALVLSYVLIQFLDTTGVMTWVGRLLGPAMAVFGLPGEASVALVAAFFAKAAGCATTASLYAKGALTATQVTILFPACITMGTLVGHFARIVLVTQTNKRWHGLLLVVPIIDAVLSMLLTRLILFLMGVGQ